MTTKFSFFWIIIIGVTITSCGIFKAKPGGKVYKDKLDEIEGTRVYNPETGKYEDVKIATEKLDTVSWTEVPESEHPPITNETGSSTDLIPGGTETTVLVDELTDLNTEKKETYNVSLILPFLSQNFSSSSKISKFSNWGLQYYAGTKLAMEDLENSGVKLNISVFDSKGEYGKVLSLTSKPQVQEADLIIGAYKKDNVKVLAKFAKENDITYISPHSASANISPNNPNYLQVSPTLSSHCKAMLRHARRTFRPEQIVLVATKNTVETKRFKYFNEENRKLENDEEAPDLKTLLIPADFTKVHEDSIKPYLDPFKTTAFLVPSFSNETFVNNFLRMLNIAKDAQPVRVYGLPQWMDFERIEFDYFENLDVHVTSSSNFDFDSNQAKEFKKKYYSNFGEIPEQPAFLGYDLMMYVGQALNKYGDKFQGYAEVVNAPNLQHRFDFQPIINGKLDDASGVKPTVEQFENKQVYLLQFKNYQFKKVN